MADKNTKNGKSKRRSRLTKSDQDLIVLGLRALVREEEDKELAFARGHLLNRVNEEGGQSPFDGDHAELAQLYSAFGIAFGSDKRVRTLDLLARLARGK